MTATNAPKDLNEVLRQLAERVSRVESKIVSGYDTGWLSLGLASGWNNYLAGWPDAQVRKKNGVVYLEGLVKDGVMGTAILTLPAGFRPSMSNSMRLVQNAAGIARVDINSGGTVSLVEMRSGSFSTSWTHLYMQLVAG